MGKKFDAPPAAPLGLQHLVLMVRDIDEANRFWTHVVGMTKVGEMRPTVEEPNRLTMNFYVGDRGEATGHHDIAVLEDKAYQPALVSAIHHFAIAYPSREAWLDRLAYLQKRGVKFERRVEHGMTHSLYLLDPNGHKVELLYDMPREVWENDRNAALNYLMVKPTEGPEALQDNVDVPVFGTK
jgi:catechol 2,3-dioxygenase